MEWLEKLLVDRKVVFSITVERMSDSVKRLQTLQILKGSISSKLENNLDASFVRAKLI